MENFQIKSFKKGDEETIHKLVKTVYDEFVKHENTKEGNQLFYDWIAPENIAGRQKYQNNLWLAWSNDKLAGIIEIRDNKNITLLFVDRQFQGHGIASALFQTMLSECIKRETAINKFFVHASLCSVPVYKNLGFSVIHKTQKENGIYYVPMEMDIRKYRITKS